MVVQALNHARTHTHTRSEQSAAALEIRIRHCAPGAPIFARARDKDVSPCRPAGRSRPFHSALANELFRAVLVSSVWFSGQAHRGRIAG
eukprot:1684161-Alexandrium_andersonii.AAC.1